MNNPNTLARITILLLLLLIALVIWRRCPPPCQPCPDPCPTSTVTSLTDGTDEDTTAGPPAKVPGTREYSSTNIDFGTNCTQWDLPGIYVNKNASNGNFRHLIVAIPHHSGHRYTGGSVTYEGSGATRTMVYTFTRGTTGSEAISCLRFDNVDPEGDVHYVKAIADGGGGTTIVAVDQADDVDPISANYGMPILFNRRNGANVEVGGFVYGLYKETPTLDAPTSGSLLWPIRRTTAGGDVKLFQCVSRSLAEDNGVMDDYEAKLQGAGTNLSNDFEQ